jgi:hypothetical protein
MKMPVIGATARERVAFHAIVELRREQKSRTMRRKCRALRPESIQCDPVKRSEKLRRHTRK